MRQLAQRNGSLIFAEADSLRAHVRVATMRVHRKWTSRSAPCSSMQCGPIRLAEPVGVRDFPRFRAACNAWQDRGASNCELFREKAAGGCAARADRHDP